MKAKITCVYDEGAIVGTPLIGAEGLSILIEVDGQRTLFDTGKNGRYLMHNLSCIKIDPNTVDRVVLSHGHRDHTGGLKTFIDSREGPIDVFADPKCWGRRAKTFLGLPLKNVSAIKPTENATVNDVTGWTQLSENLFLTGGIPSNDSGYKRKTESGWVEDAVLDEVFAVLMTREGPVVICGCCHAGVIKVLDHVKVITGKRPIALIGGTHTKGMKKKQIEGIAGSLKEEFGSPELCLCHCSGVDQRTYFRTVLGIKGVTDFYVGTVFEAYTLK